MSRLLFVSHCPSDNTQRLRQCVLGGIESLSLNALKIRSLDPLSAAAEDVTWCDGILLGTTENFGHMAGLTKDFFERIYYPCIETRQGLPFAVYIRAGQDGRGTRDSIARIASGLRWRYVSEPLILRGEYCEAFEHSVAELGMTLAAGVDAGLF